MDRTARHSELRRFVVQSNWIVSRFCLDFIRISSNWSVRSVIMSPSSWFSEDRHLVLTPSYRISGSRGSAARFLFPPPLLVRLPRPLSQTEVTGKRLRSHWRGRAARMLAGMYTINKDASGVILVCHDC